MKNVVKKLFSLLLVGVVAISMFSFVAPPAEAAEAAEAGSYGTLSIRNKGWYTARFHVSFHSSSNETLGYCDTGNLEGLGLRHSRDIKIPKNTCRIYMRIDVSGGNERTTCFCVEESTVNENSRIELTSASVFWDPEFYVGINYGWYKKY